MALLPTIDKPTFQISLPVSKKIVRFRMMTRREEKALLIAKEGQFNDQLQAIRQVIINCAVDPIDVDALPTFEAEYVFLTIRASSIGEVETMSYVDHLDNEKEHEVTINLSQVEIATPPAPSNIIECGPVKIQLRWPTVASWNDPAVLGADTAETAMDVLASHCIDKIWVGKTVTDPHTVDPSEFQKFMDDLDIKTWDKIRSYLVAAPHLSYWTGWTNSQGKEVKIELKSLQDFFSFS